MFTYRRKARYHETDQMGIIHHSNYIKWMEEARVEYMDELGMSYAGMEKTGVMSPVVELTVSYKKPVKFDEEVDITVSVKKFSGVKLVLAYTFENANTREIVTTAESTHGFIKDGRLVSLKREMPELAARLAAEMVA